MTDDLGDGRWVVRGGVRRWVPAPGEQAPSARAKFRELLEERYAEPAWWPRPAFACPPSEPPLVCARRLRYALADDDMCQRQRRSVA